MSSIETVTAKVLELAATAAPTYNVFDGFRPQMGSKFIASGDIEDGIQDYRAMRAGSKPRQEEYNLVLHLVCIEPGESPTPVRTDVMTAWSDLASDIAADPSLGLDPTWIVEPGEYDVRIRFDDNTRGWRAEVIAKIRVRARITG